MNPEKDPPTHTGWSQRCERGHFREWYKRGHLWLGTDAQGQTIVITYEGIPGPRGYDGFTYWHPNGAEPPPPPTPKHAQRPGARHADDDED